MDGRGAPTESRAEKAPEGQGAWGLARSGSRCLSPGLRMRWTRGVAPGGGGGGCAGRAPREEGEGRRGHGDPRSLQQGEVLAFTARQDDPPAAPRSELGGTGLRAPERAAGRWQRGPRGPHTVCSARADPTDRARARSGTEPRQPVPCGRGARLRLRHSVGLPWKGIPGDPRGTPQSREPAGTQGGQSPEQARRPGPLPGGGISRTAVRRGQDRERAFRDGPHAAGGARHSPPPRARLCQDALAAVHAASVTSCFLENKSGGGGTCPQLAAAH